MKVRCLLGRHKWQVDNSDPEQPVEVCARCGHYRNDDSWTDLTGAANMRPMDPSPGGGGRGFPVDPSPGGGVGGF
jgi:hypothetical protein